MNYKPDTLKKALALQTGINVSKYLYSFFIVPLLILNLKDNYIKFINVLSVLNLIFLFDFNLQNYGVNIFYKSKSNILKTKYFLSYIILFIPIVFFVSLILFYFQIGHKFEYWFIIIIFYLILNFISAQFGSLITTLKGFYFTNLISFIYNFGLVSTLFVIKPVNIIYFILINIIWSIIMFSFFIIIILSCTKNINLKIKLNLKSYYKIYLLLIKTKEYTYQKIVEYINTNYIAILILPLNGILGLQLIIFKSIFSISIFVTNFFVSIYQQLFLNNGYHSLINKIFFLNNIISSLLFFVILIYFSNPFINLVLDYFHFNMNDNIININYLWCLLIHTNLININKQYNIKRNVQNLNKENMIYPIILFIFLFLFFITFPYKINILYIFISFIIAEIFYFVIQFKF